MNRSNHGGNFEFDFSSTIVVVRNRNPNVINVMTES